MIDDIVMRFKDAVGEPVVAHELPDILDRVQYEESGPSALKRSTQSRTICKVTPPALAASLRLPPSRITASDSKHRTLSALLHHHAKRHKATPV